MKNNLLINVLLFVVGSIEYKKYLFSMSILCILLFVSNINVVGVNSNWRQKQEIFFLNSVPTPPKDCKVFFVKYSSVRCNIFPPISALIS